jgi:hypothetical protein
MGFDIFIQLLQNRREKQINFIFDLLFWRIAFNQLLGHFPSGVFEPSHDLDR